MPGMTDKIASAVTGDAYQKPAKTEAGAYTTQDSENAHTTEGTSADPKVKEKIKGAEKKAEEKAEEQEKNS